MKFIPVLAAALAMAAVTPAALADSKSKLCSEIKAVDDDTDGQLDLAEAKAAGEKVFKRINKDGDKTLEYKEVKGRLTKKEFDAANPDGDKTLELPEWLALVEARFKAANPDGDQTLECKELKTKAGKAFLKLVR